MPYKTGSFCTVPYALPVYSALFRYAPSYDDLDGGAASEVLGFPELRRQIISQVKRHATISAEPGMHTGWQRTSESGLCLAC